MSEKILAAHPLMPKPMATPTVVKWLKKTHAWIGILGAIFAFIFAWSGFMLNHRTHFSLGAPVSENEYVLPAPAEGFASIDEFAAFVDAEFNPRTRPTIEVLEAMPGTARQPATEPSFNVSYAAPGGDLTVNWKEGASEISVFQRDRGFNRIVNRLHTGRGTDGGWHLIINAYSVMLIFLSITGIFLWSRISGSVWVGGGLLGATLVLIGYWLTLGP